MEVINFTQMEKLSHSPTPKGVCDGFLHVTNACGGGPTCCHLPSFGLLLPTSALPYSLVSPVISHLPSLTSAQRGVRRGPRLTALAEVLSSLICVSGRSRRAPTMGTLYRGFCAFPTARASYPRYLVLCWPDDVGLMVQPCG